MASNADIINSIDKLAKHIEDTNALNDKLMMQVSMILDKQSQVPSSAVGSACPVGDYGTPPQSADEALTQSTLVKVIGTLVVVSMVPLSGVYMSINDNLLVARKDIETLNRDLYSLMKAGEDYEAKIKVIDDRITKMNQRLETSENLTAGSISNMLSKMREIEREKK